MGSFQKVKLCSIVLFAILEIHSCQRLSSTLFEGQRGCPGYQVNFICLTNGALVLAWSSDEYIGKNGAQIEFTSADGVNRIKASSINPNTVATLVKINGTKVIESVLSITILDSFQTASVTCSDVGQGTSTITFTLLAVPGIPQNVTADIIASTSDDCAILLQWMPPSIAESSVSHYVIDSPSGSFKTKDTSIAITLLIHHCDITTYIRIHAVDHCGRDSPYTNDTLGLLLTNTTLPSVTESRNATDSNQSSGTKELPKGTTTKEPPKDGNLYLAIVIALILIIVLLIFIIIVIVIIVLVYRNRKVGMFTFREYDDTTPIVQSTSFSESPSKDVIPLEETTSL